jgi:hypothetical protein
MPSIKITRSEIQILLNYHRQMVITLYDHGQYKKSAEHRIRVVELETILNAEKVAT